MMMVSAPADRVETARHGSKVQTVVPASRPADTPALSLPDLSSLSPTEGRGYAPSLHYRGFSASVASLNARTISGWNRPIDPSQHFLLDRIGFTQIWAAKSGPSRGRM